MINYIWNKIKNIFKPKRQEEPIVIVQEIKPEHCTKHNRFRKNCLSCREAIA